MRRGLIAGLGAMGAAALLKVTGSVRQAEAAPSALLFPAVSGDSATVNTAYSTTGLAAGAAYSANPLFSVSTLGSSAVGGLDAIYASAKGPGSWGINAAGGTGT